MSEVEKIEQPAWAVKLLIYQSELNENRRGPLFAKSFKIPVSLLQTVETQGTAFHSAL